MKYIFNPSLFAKYRSILMGWSIICIFIFHSGNIGIPIYDGLRRYGWVGVDIFFFLSALGLSFSLEKNSDTWEFYKRRAKRILPTWLLVLFCVHICGLLCNKYLPSLPFNAPHTILQGICWYTGIGFYISDFVSEPRCFCYEWYVPSLFLCYAITPSLYKQKTKYLVILFFFSIIVSHLLTSFRLLYNLHLFYWRFPAFINGYLVYRMIKYQWKFYPHALCCSFILGLISCVLLFGFDVKFTQKFVFQLLMPTFCLLIISVVKIFRLIKLLSFYGGISLELYLIHLYNRPQYLVGLIWHNKPFIVITTLVVCTLVAFCLHEFVKFILTKREKLR